MFKNITGAILSGGKSQRMGTNKSLLKFGEQTAIERVRDMMSPLFEKVNLITNEPELYQFLNLEMHQDILKGSGPISGIHTALKVSENEKVFILSCDMPFVNRLVIEYIISYPNDNKIVVPKADGFIQQLCGVYNKSLLPFIEENLINTSSTEERNPDQTKRKCKVHRLLEEVPSTIIDMEKDYPYYKNDLFFNMNTPEDYEYARKMSTSSNYNER